MKPRMPISNPYQTTLLKSPLWVNFQVIKLDTYYKKLLHCEVVNEENPQKNHVTEILIQANKLHSFCINHVTNFGTTKINSD